MVYRKFEKIKLNIIRGRKLLPFPTAKIIQDHEDRLKVLEGKTDSDTIYDDTSLNQRISALEDKFRRNLSFTVKDSESEPAPVEGAVVTVTTGKTGTTGSAGGCTITGVLDGTYTISVVAEGFENYSNTITVNENTTSFDISLVAAAVEP